VRLTAGPPGAGFHRLGERLVAAYVKLLPDTNIEVHTSAGAIANVEAIQRGQLPDPRNVRRHHSPKAESRTELKSDGCQRQPRRGGDDMARQNGRCRPKGNSNSNPSKTLIPHLFDRLRLAKSRQWRTAGHWKPIV
jgi:hypothetical protein